MSTGASASRPGLWSSPRTGSGACAFAGTNVLPEFFLRIRTGLAAEMGLPGVIQTPRTVRSPASNAATLHQEKLIGSRIEIRARFPHQTHLDYQERAKRLTSASQRRFSSGDHNRSLPTGVRGLMSNLFSPHANQPTRRYSNTCSCSRLAVGARRSCVEFGGGPRLRPPHSGSQPRSARVRRRASKPHPADVSRGKKHCGSQGGVEIISAVEAAGHQKHLRRIQLPRLNPESSVRLADDISVLLGVLRAFKLGGKLVPELRRPRYLLCAASHYVFHTLIITRCAFRVKRKARTIFPLFCEGCE